MAGHFFHKTEKSRALPRILIRDGLFVNSKTGAAFSPRGFNYIRLRPYQIIPDVDWHDTFNPKRYGGQEAESLFHDLKENGFNIVRVFIDHLPVEGILESQGSGILSPVYIQNVCDFLSRSSAAGIYAILTFPWFPESRSYHGLDQENEEDAPYHNASYFNPRYINVKIRYLSEFIRALKEISPDLMNVIFAYELENETLFCVDEPPFSLKEDKYNFHDDYYNLSDPMEKQRLADDAVRGWADLCSAAIRRENPKALVGASVFTFHAVGRSGPVSHFTEPVSDRRFPARPLALAKTSIDFLDIHLYAEQDIQASLGKNLDSVEFPRVKDECLRQGKPLIMGEFGAFKERFPTIEEAASAMKTQAELARDLGFRGWLFWTYDTEEQERLWNAKSEDGQIFHALSPL